MPAAPGEPGAIGFVEPQRAERNPDQPHREREQCQRNRQAAAASRAGSVGPRQRVRARLYAAFILRPALPARWLTPCNSSRSAWTIGRVQLGRARSGHCGHVTMGVEAAPAVKVADGRRSLVGIALVPRARRARDDAPARLPAGAAAGRPARPHGPLSGRARPRPFALAAALLRLSLGGDRQSRRRPAGHPPQQADGSRAGGEADRDPDPAADGCRVPVGCKRGAWAGAADCFFRAALHLRLSVPVRVRELHIVGGAGVPRLRPLASAGPAGANDGSKLLVRADLGRGILLPYLWLGTARADVLFG